MNVAHERARLFLYKKTCKKHIVTLQSKINIAFTGAIVFCEGVFFFFTDAKFS